MSNIGIIAGGGKLPITIGSNLIKKNFKVFFFVIEEFFNSINYKDLDVTIINLKSAKKIIETLQAKNIDSIIMAGNIKNNIFSRLFSATNKYFFIFIQFLSQVEIKTLY